MRTPPPGKISYNHSYIAPLNAHWGTHPLKISASQVLNPFSVAGFNLRLDVWPRDIQMRSNMVTSIWFDAGEMISSALIAVEVVETGEPDLDGRLMALLEGGDGQKRADGAIRWAIIVGDDGGLLLALQGLPGSVELVGSKPSLRGDNVPAIQLSTTPLGGRVFNGQLAAGPVPTLLLKHQEDMTDILENPTATLNAVWAFTDRLFRPEILCLQDATALLKKPREGKGLKGFSRKKMAATPSAAKRARPTGSDSGRHQLVPLRACV